MQRSSTSPPETTPSWAAGVRRRIPFYLLAAFLLAVLAAVVTFIYLEQLRASMVPTAAALVSARGIGMEGFRARPTRSAHQSPATARRPNSCV